MREPRILASTVDPAEAGAVIGKRTAVRSLFRALVRSGRLERVRFYAQAADPGPVRERILQGLGLGAGEAGCLEAAHIRDLPGDLREGRADVLFRPDLRLNQCVQLVHQAAPSRAVACCGLTHSLNSPEDHAALAELLLLESGPSDALACTSADARAVLGRLFDRLREGLPRLAGAAAPRLPVIPLGIEDPPAVTDRPACRAALGLGEGDLAVAYVGRLHGLVKADLRPLIGLVARLGPRLPSLRLFLAGGGDPAGKGETALLEREIAAAGALDRVRLLPNLAEADKFRLLGAADAFVSPVDNFQETFGLSIVEAMSMGLPVLASDWGGYRDLVEDGVTGFLLPTAAFALPSHDLGLAPHTGYVPLELSQAVAVDLEVLADRLALLAADPALRAGLGAAARKRSALYRWPRIVERHLDLWRELLAAPAPANPRPHLPLAQADLFASYLTRTLPDDAPLALAPHVAGEVRLPQPHPLVAEWLDRDTLGLVLNALVRGPSSLAAFSAQTGRPLPALRQAAGFLLKHGLVVPAAQSPGRPGS